jgi:hypothetical protein
VGGDNTPSLTGGAAALTAGAGEGGVGCTVTALRVDGAVTAIAVLVAVTVVTDAGVGIVADASVLP